MSSVHSIKKTMTSEDKNTDNNMDENNMREINNSEINTGENNMIEDKTSGMYSIVETIEEGNVLVTASPDLWINGHILLWPPGPANRRNPIPPQPNWISHMCRILKGSIATFDEALELEKRYSMHNDSKSFREAEDKKQLRREHPVNENPQMDLIDANSMIYEIDRHTRQANKPVAVDIVRSKYHKNCHANKNGNLNSENKKKSNVGVKVGVKDERPLLKKNLKSKNTDLEKPTLPRYKNYLKSATRTNKFSNKQTGPQLQQKKINTPKKRVISATITKEQHLKQNTISETENQDPLNSIISIPSSVRDSSKSFTGFADLQTSEVSKKDNADVVLGKFHGFNDNSGDQVQIDVTKRNDGVIKKRVANILEDFLVKAPSSSTPMFTGISFEERVLKELNELKKEQKQANEERVLFETRIATKMDIFEKGMPQNQGQSQNKCQEPDFIDENDDFEDLDENFPITDEANVLELNWSLKRDLAFRRRMQNRLNELTGLNPNASIRLKMKYLIADRALEKFTWRGTIEPVLKKPFKQLIALNDLVFASVRWQFPKYKKIDYKNYLVNNWLKHSRSRQRIVTYRYPTPQRNEDYGESDDEVEEEHEDED